jgi:Ion channel
VSETTPAGGAERDGSIVVVNAESGKRMRSALFRDLILVAGAAALAALGVAATSCGMPALSWPAIAMTDLYLLSVLLVAAILSDVKERKTTPWKFLERILPTKTAGLFVAALLLAALVSGFAGLYLDLSSDQLSKPLDGPIDALYFSFVTITTVGFGDYAPVSAFAKVLVMGQLTSGTLLLFGGFSLLIASLSPD